MAETVAAILAATPGRQPTRSTHRRDYARIRAHDDPAIFIADADEADALAEACAHRKRRSRRCRCDGVPFAIKDNIDVAGLPTTAACPAFAYRPTRTRTWSRGCAPPAPSSSARPISTSSPPAWSACARPTACRAILSTPATSPAAPAPARPSPSRRDLCRSRSAPIRRAPAGCRPALNNIVGLKPTSGLSRPPAWCRPAARSTACRSSR